MNDNTDDHPPEAAPGAREDERGEATDGQESSRRLRDFVREGDAGPGPINPRGLSGTLEIRSDDLQEMWVP